MIMKRKKYKTIFSLPLNNTSKNDKIYYKKQQHSILEKKKQDKINEKKQTMLINIKQEKLCKNLIYC